MRLLLEECTTRFDWVLLDTPPVAFQSDSQLLSRLTQAAVFVIRAGVTPYQAVERAIFDIGRESIVGIVLNAVEPNAVSPTSYEGDYGE
jgi:Mrp family chromosome partitioning ATPase